MQRTELVCSLFKFPTGSVAAEGAVAAAATGAPAAATTAVTAQVYCNLQGEIEP